MAVAIETLREEGMLPGEIVITPERAEEILRRDIADYKREAEKRQESGLSSRIFRLFKPEGRTLFILTSNKGIIPGIFGNTVLDPNDLQRIGLWLMIAEGMDVRISDEVPAPEGYDKISIWPGNKVIKFQRVDCPGEIGREQAGIVTWAIRDASAPMPEPAKH